MTDDRDLLARYAESADQEAFAEIVRRHLDLVYSSALRQLGDIHLAEDVCQMVFAKLAGKPRLVRGKSVLAGWLFTDARLTALQLLRRERRRIAREQKAMDFEDFSGTRAPDWQEARPIIDELLAKLDRSERDALLLRYFEQQSLREVAAEMQWSEDAARMRLSRAITKLRRWLSRRGIHTTGSAISAVLAAHAIEAAPASLSGSVISFALVPPGASAGVTWTVHLTNLLMSKAKITITTLIGLGIVTPLVWQVYTNQSLRSENLSLQQRIQTLEGVRQDFGKQVADLNAQLDQTREERAELARLRGEVTRLRNEQRGMKAAKTSAQSAPPLPAAEVTDPDAEAFLRRPAAEQGQLFGNFRREMMTRNISSPAEFAKNHALASAVRPKLDELEKQPSEFAAFQSSFIQAAIGLDDDQKISQIRQIIQNTYEQAVANHLDAPSRPVEGVEDWAKKRDALDRRATHVVQQLLNGEERERFDRAFLGVMGIDLGINDGATHRFVAPNGAIVFPSEQGAPSSRP